MSVLIKGMEMPVGCAFCEIKRRLGKIMVCPFCNEEWDIHDPMSAEYRLAGCPLVPVPPHGRLIDADALDADLERQDMHTGEWDAVGFSIDEIENAPTVIPAEEGE